MAMMTAGGVDLASPSSLIPPPKSSLFKWFLPVDDTTESTDPAGGDDLGAKSATVVPAAAVGASSGRWVGRSVRILGSTTEDSSLPASGAKGRSVVVMSVQVTREAASQRLNDRISERDSEIGGKEKQDGVAHARASEESLVLLVSSQPPTPAKRIPGAAAAAGVVGRERADSDDDSMPVPLIVGKQRVCLETQITEGETTKTECKLFINICCGRNVPIGCWVVNQVGERAKSLTSSASLCSSYVHMLMFVEHSRRSES